MAQDIKSSLQLLHKSVTLFEPRFTTKAIRNLPALRKVIKESDTKEGGGVVALAQVVRELVGLGECLLALLRGDRAGEGGRQGRTRAGGNDEALSLVAS